MGIMKEEVKKKKGFWYWVLWIIIILVVFKIDKKAFYLLIPYLLWVSFAGILNYLMI